MKRRCTGMVVVLLFCSLSLVIAGQQAGSPASLTEFLTVTDRQAIEQWTRSTYGQQPDPKDPPGDTQFLLSLTATGRQGAFLFKQRCNVCHGAAMDTPTSYAPLLSRKNVEGRDDFVRKLIMDGSALMPAFRHGLQPAQIDSIIEYLKKVERPLQQFCCP